MKRTINLVLMLMAALMTLSLVSCSSSVEHSVMLKNSTIVHATDEFGRFLPKGCYVTITSTSLTSEWRITNDGMLQRDTSYMAGDSLRGYVAISIRTGVIMQ